jgi:hypothetical protein
MEPYPGLTSATFHTGRVYWNDDAKARAKQAEWMLSRRKGTAFLCQLQTRISSAVKRPDMPNSQDRVVAIAALIRETPGADRDALVCSIVSRWPDVTDGEIEQAVELASALRAELIED